MQNESNMPLSNIEYDIVSILYEKSKALEAYDKFLDDAESDGQLLKLLQTIKQEDLRQVEELKFCLQRLLQDKEAS